MSDAGRIVQKHSHLLNTKKQDDEQYQKDRQKIIADRTPATTPSPVDPTKNSYVFMLELGQWKIMYKGQSLNQIYPNRKDATTALKLLEGSQTA